MAFSRRTHFPNCPFPREDPQEFKELVDDLRQEYQPRGTLEELEVERIAACWWRLKRAWRYENAELTLGRVEVMIRTTIPVPMADGYRTALSLLQAAEKEVKAGKEIPQDLKPNVFAALPALQERWPVVEQLAKQLAQKFAEKQLRRWTATIARRWGMSVRKLTGGYEAPAKPDDHIVALQTIWIAIRFIEVECKYYFDHVVHHAHELAAMPKQDVAEKVLRYEAANDRSLNRALDRLERLQRSRKAEATPPPVRVPQSARMTQ